MLNFLSLELASRNPAAYTAHFRRLEAAEQAQYLAGLDAQALQAHLAAVGATATLGFVLTFKAGQPTLAAMVAGKALPAATGWAAAAEAQTRARTLAAQLGVPVATGLLTLSSEDLTSVTRLRDTLGWGIEQISVWLDEEQGTQDWAVSGHLAAGGAFWSARQTVREAEGAALRARLELAAGQLGVTVDVRAL